jgi:PPOX class probable F420-dependent enzyme
VSIARLFARQKYLNIETLRKNGVGVRTPVWFVQDGIHIYIRTGANSGKVKRLRNNPQVNIAPCKMDGTLVGDWVPASAREVKDEATANKVDQLLGKKYGLIEKLFSLMGGRNGLENTIIELKVGE